MIKHIVMFKIKDGIDGRSKAESIVEAKRQVESMNGKIPGLLNIEVGFDFSATAASFDMVIYSELESHQALEAYNTHPVHLPVLAFMKSVLSERCLVDYEI